MQEDILQVGGELARGRAVQEGVFGQHQEAEPSRGAAEGQKDES
jgi:hypothetical protein